jgi:transposase
MRRTAETLPAMRLLAVRRLEEGWTQEGVAEFLEVGVRTVRRWWGAWVAEGEAGLALKAGRGRPAKLTDAQAERVLGWLDGSPTAFGFATERWTAPRVAAVLEKELGVRMHARYLNDWLRRHGATPQMPARVPREKDPALIDGWVRCQWPRLKKRRGG